MLQRLIKAVLGFEHKAHHYQILLAIIVAAIILTYALLGSRPPLVTPRTDRTAIEGKSPTSGQTGRTVNGGLRNAQVHC